MTLSPRVPRSRAPAPTWVMSSSLILTSIRSENPEEHDHRGQHGSRRKPGNGRTPPRLLRRVNVPALRLYLDLVPARRGAARFGIGAKRGGGWVGSGHLVPGLPGIDVGAQPIGGRGFGFSDHDKTS